MTPRPDGIDEDLAAELMGLAEDCANKMRDVATTFLALNLEKDIFLMSCAQKWDEVEGWIQDGR